MSGTSKARPRKRAMNVSIPFELAEEAKAFGTNVSAVLERALNEDHRAKRREAWREANRKAMDRWNHWIAENGIPFEDLRPW
jgi:post-segregation antitoxin (ccd killing protein)